MTPSVAVSFPFHTRSHKQLSSWACDLHEAASKAILVRVIFSIVVIPLLGACGSQSADRDFLDTLTCV